MELLKEIRSDKSDSLQISVNSIDVDSGIIRGVKEANEGLNKNGYWFTSNLLEELKNAGNSGNGIKCRFGHPNEFGESLGTYVGRKKNYRVVNNALFCDLHLDVIAKETKLNGVSHWDWILKMAESNPDMFGNSVVFMPASMDIQEFDGKEYPVPTLKEFRASDLVDEPAATNHLFNSETKNTMSKEIKGFLESIKLSVNEAVQKLLEPKVNENDVTETLDTGIMVTIETDETDVPKEGDKVVLEDGTPAPDGEHTTESGLIVTTEGGLIITIAEAEPETTEEVPEETIEQQFKAHQKDFIQFQEDTKGFMEFTAKSFSDTLAKITADSEAKELAFNDMKEKYEASEAKYTLLASSIESPEALKFDKETLPKVETEVDRYLASKKRN